MAVRFDGTVTNYQSIAAGPDINASYTWMAWCKLVGSTGALGIVFIVRNSDGAQSDFICTGSTGDDVSIVVNGGAAGAGDLPEWDVGETHHFAMVRASQTDLKLYKNGVQIGSTLAYDVGTSRTIVASESGAALGITGGWNGHKFGEKIWNRALTAAEIVNEMRTLRPQSTTSLLAVYPAIANTASGAAVDYADFRANWTNNGTVTVEDNGAGVSWGGSSIIVPFAATAAAAETAFQFNAF